MTPDLTIPRIEVRRFMRVDPATGLLPVGMPWSDTVQLVLRDGTVITPSACSLPTVQVGSTSPPVIEPGWYPEAMCVGIHRGRKAIVNQGRLTLAARRHDGTTFGGNRLVGDYRGLNIHDPIGEHSAGCILVPEDIMRAMVALLERRDERIGPIHPVNLTPMIGLWVRDMTAERMECAA